MCLPRQTPVLSASLEKAPEAHAAPEPRRSPVEGASTPPPGDKGVRRFQHTVSVCSTICIWCAPSGVSIFHHPMPPCKEGLTSAFCLALSSSSNVTSTCGSNVRTAGHHLKMDARREECVALYAAPGHWKCTNRSHTSEIRWTHGFKGKRTWDRTDTTPVISPTSIPHSAASSLHLMPGALLDGGEVRGPEDNGRPGAHPAGPQAHVADAGAAHTDGGSVIIAGQVTG
jgi:hypothetical protein